MRVLFGRRWGRLRGGGRGIAGGRWDWGCGGMRGGIGSGCRGLSLRAVGSKWVMWCGMVGTNVMVVMVKVKVNLS